MFKLNQRKYVKLYQIIFQYTFLHTASINRKICVCNFFQDQADAYSKEIPDTLEKRKKTGRGAMLSF